MAVEECARSFKPGVIFKLRAKAARSPELKVFLVLPRSTLWLVGAGEAVRSSLRVELRESAASSLGLIIFLGLIFF